jgi:hypothetical protein
MSSEGMTLPEAAPEDSPGSSVLPAKQAAHGGLAKDLSPNGLETTGNYRSADQELLRRLVNLALIVLCDLAVSVYMVLHGQLLGGIISALAGPLMVALPKFLIWAIRGYEEEIEKKIRHLLGDLRLRRWLLCSFTALVLFNLVFLPKDVKASIVESLYGRRVMLRIVPVGNLYTALTIMQKRDDVRFDLSIRRGNQIYRLEKIGPGLVYTGAAKEDLRGKHDSQPQEPEQLAKIAFQDSSIISKDDLSEIKAHWQEVRYLASVNFRENQRIEIEVGCAGESRPEVLAKTDVTLEDYPLQTVYLDAELKDNPCVPPD